MLLTFPLKKLTSYWLKIYLNFMLQEVMFTQKKKKHSQIDVECGKNPTVDTEWINALGTDIYIC